MVAPNSSPWVKASSGLVYGPSLLDVPQGTQPLDLFW